MKVLVLGATGNIGQQVISLIKKLNYQLVGISYYANDKLAQKIEAKYVYSPINKVQSNVKSYNQLIKLSNPDIVVNAIVGFVGLKATLATIRNKKTLCLANKESLVVAGQFVMKLAKQKQVNIFPIDSEHTAIYQIISQKGKSFKKLYITASGGPFYNLSKNELTHISLKQAINHPT
jgi:1-deoxy-D-xylulose-5-phosphate reductoisomerase